jgi:hypothetical protein
VAVNRYLGRQPERRTGVFYDDLLTAARLAGEWRREAPRATAAILYNLHVHYNFTFQALADLTGIPMRSCHRLVASHKTELGRASREHT